MTQTHIIGISGSLRKESYNTGLLKAAKKACPKEATVEIVDISEIPPYNQDEEANMLEVVSKLKLKVKQADGVLFVTPEYNYSMPGVLKNAIDWISRPYGQNSFEGKPAGIMSASIASTGGARAQYHLRQSMVYLNMYPMNIPEVMVADAADKYEQGKLVDEETLEYVEKFMQAFVAWVKNH